MEREGEKKNEIGKENKRKEGKKERREYMFASMRDVG